MDLRDFSMCCHTYLVKCEENCPILNTSIRDLSNQFNNVLSNILLVFRDDEKFIVNSKTKLKQNDVIYFVVDAVELTLQ